MDYGNQKKILCRNNRFILSSSTVKGKLKLQIEVIKINKKSQQYEVIRKFAKLFYLGYHPDLRVQFKQISYFMSHLRNQDNFQIDVQQGIIKVYGKEGKFKQNSKKIGIIKFEQKRLTQNYQPINYELRYWKVEQNNVKIEQQNDNKSENEQQVYPKSSQDCYGEKVLINQQIQQLIDRKINEIKQKYKRLIKTMVQNIKQLQQKMEYLTNKIMQQNNILQKIISKFNEYSSQQMHSKKNYGRNIAKTGIKNINNSTKTGFNYAKQAQECFEFQSRFSQDKIIPLCDNEGQMRIIFGQQIKLSICEIKVKLIEIKDKIGLGIVSKINKQVPNILFSQGVFILQSDGDIYCQGRVYQKLTQHLKIQNQGILTVCVDKLNGQIQWKIGNESILKLQNCEKVKSNEHIWIPIVVLFGKNDIIMFC